MAVVRSPFLMFFYRLDLVFHQLYNYTICGKQNGKRFAALLERTFTE